MLGLIKTVKLEISQNFKLPFLCWPTPTRPYRIRCHLMKRVEWVEQISLEVVDDHELKFAHDGQDREADRVQMVLECPTAHPLWG